MDVNISEKKLQGQELISALVGNFKIEQEKLGLTNSNLYYDFPVFKDLDGAVIVAQVLLISELHGAVIFCITNDVDTETLSNNLENRISELDGVYTTIYSRLLRNKSLRRDKMTIKVPINSVIYAPNIANDVSHLSEEVKVFNRWNQIEGFLEEIKLVNADNIIYKELKSTIEGSKGLIIPSKRENVEKDTKGDVVNELEQEIASFDQYQKSAYMSVLTGASRIRGLAGSGKTVVLAMKAAITHLRHPEAKIAFTFYTKSLYQHIKRLITRFYRQFDDKDPNWDKLEIMHAWGSFNLPGLYYNACIAHDEYPLTYTEASKFSRNAFDFACNRLLQKPLEPIYDFVFIDEGQDFPSSFLRVCSKITTTNRLIWAYDELQTIFQVQTPSPKEIFGVNDAGESSIELEEDIILYKCYRNPREILVTAHAIGFGIYSGNIVQMIDSAEYWSDIGYVLETGKLTPGTNTILLRPEENSLRSISQKYPINHIIRGISAEDQTQEMESVCNLINEDIKQGLLPEDILVITVDDRYASSYLSNIQQILATKYNIKSNNIHSDKFSVKDFQVKGAVTLSTVHKAKGNEAYSVYIVGVDALFSLRPEIRERNILFTAMTRSKAWLCVSGIASSAELCFKEIRLAFEKFPKLEFIYPNKKEMKIMKRDINDKAIRKSKVEKTLDDLLSQLGPDEIQRFIEQRTKKKGK